VLGVVEQSLDTFEKSPSLLESGDGIEDRLPLPNKTERVAKARFEEHMPDVAIDAVVHE